MILRGYSGPKETKYLFIDGGFLRELSKKFSSYFLDGEPVDFEYSRLKGVNTKVFYYDALPKRRHKETNEAFESRLSAQKKLFDEIQSQNFFHSVVGAIDGNVDEGLAQKGVDVRLAVDALLHSLRGNTRNVTIFTSDSDFIPLLSALVENGVNVTLMYDPQKANEFLVRSADVANPISASAFKQYLSSSQQADLNSRFGWTGESALVNNNQVPPGAICQKNIELGPTMFSFLEKDDLFFCERYVVSSKKLLGAHYSKDLSMLRRLLEWDYGLKVKQLDY